MAENITVMTWNTNGEGGISHERIQAQKEFFDEHHEDTDIFLLQAVDHFRKNNHLEQLKGHLEKRGYNTVDTSDWNRELIELDVQPYHDIRGRFKHCLLTASRWRIERTPLDLKNNGGGKPVGLNYFYTNFPNGLLVSDVRLPGREAVDSEELEIWNGGIVHGTGWKEEKINALETVYARIYLQNKKTDKEVILGGDFNAPLKELDERDSEGDGIEIVPHSGNDYKATNRPFYGTPYWYRNSDGEPEPFTFSQRWQNAERYIFDSAFSDWDMKDTYWVADESAKKSSMDDPTHVVNNGNPANKRLDHILASDDFDVLSCEIQNGDSASADGFAASDHAPVVTELELS